MPKLPGEADARNAAKLIGASVRTIRSWAKAGKLTSARVDGTGHFFVRRAELEAMIEAADELSRQRREAWRAEQLAGGGAEQQLEELGRRHGGDG